MFFEEFGSRIELCDEPSIKKGEVKSFALLLCKSNLNSDNFYALFT